MRTAITVLLTLSVAACEQLDQGQMDASKAKPEQIINTLSANATDSKQRELWKNVKPSLASNIKQLSSSGGEVKMLKPVEVPDIEVQRPGYPPLSESLITGVNLLQVPELAEPFDGKARLVAVRQDTLEFDLGKKRTLQLQAKMGGKALLMEKDVEIKLRLQVGDPFMRNDILEISNGKSALSWALVGGDEPVTIKFNNLNLVARQIGQPQEGRMLVELRAGDESKVLTDFAKPVQFPKTGISVHVLGSIGATGDKAGVLPQNYRLEITAWPSQ
jgi:hypothetical protein